LPGQVELVPIAILTPNGLVKPPDGDPASDPAAAAFAKRFFPEGKAYLLLRDGQRIGSATVQAAGVTGCIAPSATARLRLDRQGPGAAPRALAIETDRAGSRPASSRTPTAEEERAIRDAADAVYRQKGVPVAKRKRVEVRGMKSVLQPGQSRPVLAGAFEIDQSGGGDAGFLSVLVVLEAGAQGYRPVMTRYSDAAGEQTERWTVLDTIDLEGDGSPEVVVQNSGWEAWSYGILARRKGRWSEVYDGGGGGC
jgi:hypothetical protein